jgi:hypothetical protein
MEAHPRLLVELGSGDGAGILASARRRPDTLCVGIDTDADAPREASARAARAARKGGLPNALFLAADARSLPAPFVGRIDELRIILPWGSLLRAVLRAEADLVGLVADGLRTGGRARVAVSLTTADEQAVGVPVAAGRLLTLADALERAGLPVMPPRPFVAADAADLRSSWAKRLGIPARRPATILEARGHVIAPAPSDWVLSVPPSARSAT